MIDAATPRCPTCNRALRTPLRREVYGKALRALRVRLGWSQAELAELLRVSRPTVNLWESNAQRPHRRRLDEIRRLAAANNVTFR